MTIPEPIKAHWPLVLGGIAGLYIVYRYMHAASNASSATLAAPSGPTAADLQSQSIAQQGSLGMAQLSASVAASNNAAQTANLLAQGQVALNLGQGASQLVTALEMPTLQAINSSAVADSAAMQSAGQAASASYFAQASMLSSASAGVNAVALTASNTSATFARQSGSGAQAAQSASQGNASNASTWASVASLALLAA